MVPLPEDSPAALSSASSSRKPLIALLVIGLLAAVAAGAVLATLRSSRGLPPVSSSAADAAAARAMPSVAVREAEDTGTPTSAERSSDLGGESASVDEPQEWERELVRARRALMRERFDRAYAIADELPADSVLRETPEFGEIRYRYVQSHIHEAERALRDGDVDSALREVALVLEVQGITPKQRQEARRLDRRAKATQGRRIVD